MSQSLAYFSGATPRVLAHRGLVDEFGVENTLSAFAAAAHCGVTHIETDVQVTRDGVPVLFHDDTLLRVAGIRMKIRSLTLAELKKIDIGFGNRVPTLEEAFKRFPQLFFNLDVKVAKAAPAIAEVVNRLELHDRVLLTSFSDRRRKQATSLLHRPVAASAGSATVLRLVAAATPGLSWLKPKQDVLAQIQAVQIPIKFGPLRLDRSNFIAKLNDLKLEVHFWTVNNPAEVERLLSIGAAGFVTDKSDLVISAIRNR
ncbi:MAG: hypothetical protein RLY13_197 [Actinomycetota bacterium]